MKDSVNRYRSSSLFWETRVASEEGNSDFFEPIFTLKEKPLTVHSKAKNNSITYPSLREIYFLYDHVPSCEYEFAMDVFGSWDHWKALAASSALRDFVSDWREELAIRLKAAALQEIMKAAREPNAIGINCARYLADEGYLPRKVGRMSREEKARQLKLAAGVKDTLQNDMSRLGLEVINGGK